MRPFQPLTSLEEDFKEIGLLPKTENKPAETAEEKVESKKDETAPEVKPEGDKLDEVKQVRLKRHTAADRLKWRKSKKKAGAKAKAKKYRNKSSVKRMLKRHQMKADKMRHGKAAGRKRLQFQGLDNLANLLEQVQEVVDSLSESRRTQAVRGFANMAIIAELMGKYFAKTAVESKDDELEEAAEFFAEMAENCADLARALNEGEEFDFSNLSETFEESVNDLADGLDLYVDLSDDQDLEGLLKTEGCDDDEEDEEEEDEDEDEDEEEDEGNEE